MKTAKHSQMRSTVVKYLEEFIMDLKDSDYKVSKASILYNYLVKEKPSASQVQLFAEVLFKDKDELYPEIMTRISG